MSQWIWQPYFPPQPILAAGAALAVLAIVAYARTWRHAPAASAGLVLMRLVLLAVVVALLLGPSTLPESSLQESRPTLRILVDRSRSMQTEDMGGEARYDFAMQRWLSDGQLAHLGQGYDIEWFAFGHSLRATARRNLQGLAAERATDGITHLAAAVEQAIVRAGTGEDGGALLLLSDGRDSDDASLLPAARLARAHDVVVHAVPLGGADLQR
ncbi:MAG: hypothetical protein ACODAQ_06480, partial [Phycisphaeraceae bacterium]